MRRITQGLVLLLVLGLSVGLMSCGGDDEDENITGAYRGSITDNNGFVGNQAQLTLQQNGTFLTGSFSPFPGTQVGIGVVEGLVNDSRVTFKVDRFTSDPDCTFLFDGGVDDDELSGSYVSDKCLVVSSGTFDFERQ